jgi:hypothetical protein
MEVVPKGQVEKYVPEMELIFITFVLIFLQGD